MLDSSLCGYQHFKEQHHLILLLKTSPHCITPAGTPAPPARARSSTGADGHGGGGGAALCQGLLGPTALLQLFAFGRTLYVLG